MLLPSLHTDGELTLVLGLMSLLLLAAIVLLIVANRIGQIQKEIEAEKKCPYCAESIKKEAIICRFCGRDLPVSESPKQSTSLADPVMAEANIQEPVGQPGVTYPGPKVRSKKQLSSAIALILVMFFGAIFAGLMIKGGSEYSTPASSSVASGSSSFSSSSTSSSNSSNRNTVSLYMDGTEILCGRTEQDYEDLIAALVREDEYGFGELFLLDRAFVVDSRTIALVLDLSFSIAKVRILEGAHANEICYTAIEAVNE